jgi:hypothetical protein
MGQQDRAAMNIPMRVAAGSALKPKLFMNCAESRISLAGENQR